MIRSAIVILLFLYSFLGLAQQSLFSDVLPIIQTHCTPCHQSGDIGPMPLTNYDEISAFGQMIKYVTGIRYMPPYLPSGEHGYFVEERRLSIKELAAIDNWVTEGMPRDTVQSILRQIDQLTPAFAADAEFALSDSFEHYGVYYDQYRVFIVPTNLPTDTFISAIEFIPGNHEIVRNAYISVAVDSGYKYWDQWDPGIGYFSFGEIGFVPFESRWYTWHPQKPADVLSANQVKFLPKGSQLIFHIHYGPSNKKQKDLSRIRLKFETNRSQNVIKTTPLIHPTIYTQKRSSIAANEKIKIHARFDVPHQIQLLGIMPHAHFLCRDWDIFIKHADNSKITSLLKIDDWDFKWRQMYHLDQPILLNKGDEIHVMAAYDNTLDNPLNPSDPPRAMEWGKRMFEEMMMVFMEYIESPPVDDSPLHVSKNSSLVSRQSRQFRIDVDSASTISASLYTTKKEKIKDFFKKKYFEVGPHEFALDLIDVSHGNFVIIFHDEKGRILAHHLMAYVADEDFGAYQSRK